MDVLLENEVEFPYVQNLTVRQFVSYVADHFPVLADVIDYDRMNSREMKQYVQHMNKISWEFEDTSSGGRGLAYNKAQINVGNRMTGIQGLLGALSQNGVELKKSDIVLDVLAGDGTISRALRAEGRNSPYIINADLSQLMVSECLRNGLPCIRQSAARSLLRNGSLDGVLIAYGSHHLSDSDRNAAFAEAYRTLKPGGRLVVHDFETAQPAAVWFNDVVHPYSSTGHPHPHFSREELYSRAYNCGFRDVRVRDLYDPFKISGASEAEAIENVVMHMYYMYDLTRITSDPTKIVAATRTQIEKVFGPIKVAKEERTYVATIDRVALVATAVKN